MLRAGQIVWWALKDLNLRPKDYESSALTAELRAQVAATRSAAVSQSQDFRFERISQKHEAPEPVGRISFAYGTTGC